MSSSLKTQTFNFFDENTLLEFILVFIVILLSLIAIFICIIYEIRRRNSRVYLNEEERQQQQEETNHMRLAVIQMILDLD